MENIKYILTLIIILVILVFVGYWAFFTIEPGSTHVDKQKQEELEKKNTELEKEVVELKSELAALQPKEEVIPEESIDETTPIIDNTPLKYQSLIDDLQKLIDDNISMKLKSKGTRVGTVQEFLNIYNNTSKKIDNDFGDGTKTDVIKFQKAEGLTADGEAGPDTFIKMIAWLKTQ